MYEGENFRRLIKRLRLQKGLTQEGLAKLCEVTTPYISQVELGKRIPTEKVCKKLAVALDYDYVELTNEARRAKSLDTSLMLYGREGKTEESYEDDLYLRELKSRLQRLRAKQHLSELQYVKLLETLLKVIELQEMQGEESIETLVEN